MIICSHESSLDRRTNVYTYSFLCKVGNGNCYKTYEVYVRGDGKFNFDRQQMKCIDEHGNVTWKKYIAVEIRQRINELLNDRWSFADIFADIQKQQKTINKKTTRTRVKRSGLAPYPYCY